MFVESSEIYLSTYFIQTSKTLKKWKGQEYFLQLFLNFIDPLNDALNNEMS